VLAGLQHADGEVGVRPHRRGDEYRVQLVIGQQVVEVGGEARAAVHGRQALAHLGAAVAAPGQLGAGERVSYGLQYELAADSVIATVPLGYADGVPRRYSSVGGQALIGGRRLPIAGRVTMDQLLVDCGPDAAVTVGDEVVLLGRQGDEVIDATDWAERLGTVPYEILCGISARVARRYVGAAG